ncbi:MAG: sensor histidine kinase [Candidatus Latescibacteria bacterium]|nr:sensor histidine kinase [bacterium]MBD3424882.1 sensor histidine kinase [Candidatus Latescibacterota bacterium]
MDSYFATPDRTGDSKLSEEINLVSSNPVTSGLLHSVGGLLAVLDKNRQIIALNDSFIKKLGIENPGDALGLRPGEALECVHADEQPGGCGTSRYCSTCGAAISIVTSLGENEPVERKCALSYSSKGEPSEMALLVRAHPVDIDGNKFILLFLRDITATENRAALERTFFHDINNMLNMLAQAGEILIRENNSDIAETIHTASARLLKEVALQHSLSVSEPADYRPLWKVYDLAGIIDELKSFFRGHPAGRGRELKIKGRIPHLSIKTDISALMRVLSNMVINALEATEEGGSIRVWAERQEKFLSFLVWNRGEIPREISYRIFQRNFSTKEGEGRGIGTYSMKLFGEKVLGGRVSFSTSEEEGTVFIFKHPLQE